MEAHTFPLGDVLKQERRYVIPTFQRDYEWTAEGQWQLLFDDLESVADRLFERREYAEFSGTATDESTISPHFLGAIVCDTMPFTAGGITARAVIDGQQRLTTLQLLCRGLLDVATERDVDGSFRLQIGTLRRMLRNPEDSAASKEEIYKLWPRRHDRMIWPLAMDDDVPNYADHPDHLYLQARKYFSQATRESLQELDEDATVGRLRALVDALSTLFKLVVIDLHQNDDAQVIFEVLNGRQTPLSAIDLVKNLLFLRGELSSDDVDDLYDRYWAGFDSDWWKIEVGTGHAQRGHRDMLLSAWLTATTGSEASVSHLYRGVRAYLDREKPKTEEVLAELAKYAAAYRQIYGEEPIADPRLRISYDRLLALQNLTAVPLLAWLRTLGSDLIGSNDHLRAVRAIESYTVRRVIMRWQTRGYAQIFVRVLKAAKSAHASGGAAIADAVVTTLADASLWFPTNDDLRNAFATYGFYGSIGQARIRLILSAIDVQMRRENPMVPSASFEYDSLQIEHVMPRKWEPHWPLAADVDPDDPSVAAATQTRNGYVDRIGNLTLVTSTFNQSVSNLAWTVKRPEFAHQASLELNKAIGGAATWDEGSIDRRGEHLLTVALKIWPSLEDLGYADSSPVDAQTESPAAG